MPNEITINFEQVATQYVQIEQVTNTLEFIKEPDPLLVIGSEGHQGPRGPQGSVGPAGPDLDTDLVDLTLLFEAGNT